MNIFFNFVKTLNKDYMFKIGLSRFMEIQAKLTIIMRKRDVLQLVMQLIVYTMQFNCNFIKTTYFQFQYNYTHDVMLTSIIVIHLLKSDMWHYEKI
jgi:hypothetical protein